MEGILFISITAIIIITLQEYTIRDLHKEIKLLQEQYDYQVERDIKRMEREIEKQIRIGKQYE